MCDALSRNVPRLPAGVPDASVHRHQQFRTGLVEEMLVNFLEEPVIVSVIYSDAQAPHLVP